MPTWFNWIPLHPLIEKYHDDGTRDLSMTTIEVKDVGTFEVALVGAPDRIELIRVATLESDGNLTQQQLDVVDKLMEHSLALLRLAIDPSYQRLRLAGRTPSIGAHGVEAKPQLNISMKEYHGSPGDIGVAFGNGLAATIGHRPLVILLADSFCPALPLQYRYLSLYKILELEFRTSGIWKGLNTLLSKYNDKYDKLGISERSLQNIVHEMRDKCAHIKVGHDDNIGLIGLSGKDAIIARQLTDLLCEVVADHINGKNIGIVVNPPPTGDWVPESQSSVPSP